MPLTRIRYMLAAGFALMLLTTSLGTQAGNYKLKIANTYPYPLKMKWYCKGKRKDADTFPVGTKTRELSDKKCDRREDLTVRIGMKGTGKWYYMNGYFQPSAYKNAIPKFSGADTSQGMINFIKRLEKNTRKDLMKASYLTEIKFDKIPGNGDKRCLIVSADIVLTTTVSSYLGLPAPAFYPKAGKC